MNLSDKYLRDISLSFIIAGKDTSANTLTWFFYKLCKHKLIQEKVALEVKEVTAEYTYSINEFSHKLTETALEKMHYLHDSQTLSSGSFGNNIYLYYQSYYISVMLGLYNRSKIFWLKWVIFSIGSKYSSSIFSYILKMMNKKTLQLQLQLQL